METRFYIDTADPTPIYAQLERAIRFAIATERLREGDQLPTVRQLAVDLKINANTVAKVYSELERAGVVETRRGVGTFVRAQNGSPILRTMRSERELRAFVERMIVEAQRLGISLDEVIDHLMSRRKKENENGEYPNSPDQ
ncbi:MAG: GntR family transcriptional regulator [Acidobacteria bacterium]|nr:GntR family transcriptional regulator [Acidobacteriota bacterium]